jgi:hypothetical protein
MTEPLYIVLDMDETLGCVMPLYDFVEGVDAETLARRVTLIASSEINDQHQTYILRPSWIPVFRYLAHYNKSRDRKYDVRCYILSNNASQALVDFLAAVCNVICGATLFHGAFSRYSPSRGRDTETKSLSVLRAAIGDPSLGAHNVLFFDDLKHVLTDELGGNGIQVTPYSHFTPINTLATLFGVQGTPQHAKASKNAQPDVRNYIHHSPWSREHEKDYYENEGKEFLQIVKTALHGAKMSGGSRMPLITTPPQPASLSQYNALATWPGGMGAPQALLYSTDASVPVLAKVGGRRQRSTRRTTRRRRTVKKRGASRRHRRA